MRLKRSAGAAKEMVSGHVARAPAWQEPVACRLAKSATVQSQQLVSRSAPGGDADVGQVPTGVEQCGRRHRSL